MEAFHVNSAVQPQQFVLMPDLSNLNLSTYHMGNYNVTTNLFYLVYKYDVPTAFMVMIGIRWMVAIVGTVMNATLFYVAFSSKCLFGPCNALIGFNALCSALFQPHLTIGLFVMLSGIFYINTFTCACMSVMATVSYNLILATMFFIGLDRVICVRYTLWHRYYGQSWVYLAIILTLSLIYAFVFLYTTFSIAIGMPELQIICSSPDDLYQGPLGKQLFRANFAVSLLVVLVYVLLWVCVRVQNMSNSSNQRIIRSLSVMMMVLVMGWLLNSAMRIVLPLLPDLSPVAMCYITFASAILPHIAIASNAPILYAFSHDYRRNFHLQLPWLFSHFTQNMPLQTVVPQKSLANPTTYPTHRGTTSLR